jgi:hypothetical protein
VEKYPWTAKRAQPVEPRGHGHVRDCRTETKRYKWLCQKGHNTVAPQHSPTCVIKGCGALAHAIPSHVSAWPCSSPLKGLGQAAPGSARSVCVCVCVCVYEFTVCHRCLSLHIQMVVLDLRSAALSVGWLARTRGRADLGAEPTCQKWNTICEPRQAARRTGVSADLAGKRAACGRPARPQPATARGAGAPRRRGAAQTRQPCLGRRHCLDTAHPRRRCRCWPPPPAPCAAFDVAGLTGRLSGAEF